MNTIFGKKIAEEWIKIESLDKELEKKAFMKMLREDTPPMNLPRELLEPWLALTEARERYQRLIIKNGKLFIKLITLLQEMTLILDIETQEAIVKLLTIIDLEEKFIQEESIIISDKLKDVVNNGKARYI